jgi:hypothetical protein
MDTIWVASPSPDTPATQARHRTPNAIPHLGFVFAAVARKRCQNPFASIGQRFVTMSRLFPLRYLGFKRVATPGLEVCSPTSQKIKGRLYCDVSFFASITAKVSAAPPRVTGI